MTPRPGALSWPDAASVAAERERIGPEGIIRAVHDYCEHNCPRRERCPGMACRLYRYEQDARDELLTLDGTEQPEQDAPSAYGISLTPTI